MIEHTGKESRPNFDCSDIYSEHAFLVRLTPRSSGAMRDGKAQVFEVFGRINPESDVEWAPETVLRCETSRDVWDSISADVRSEFNRRLKLDHKSAGRWGAEETAVQRLLGKELLVLLWSIELADVTANERLTAVENWLGLKPEERWWLYTMTAAATGLAHQHGIGWRVALRHALCFGSRADAFHLGTVTGRGTLVPRKRRRRDEGRPSLVKPKQERDACTGDLDNLLTMPSLGICSVSEEDVTH